MQAGWLAMSTNVSFLVLEFGKSKIEMIEPLLSNGILLLRLRPFPVILCNLMSKRLSLCCLFFEIKVSLLFTWVWGDRSLGCEIEIQRMRSVYGCIPDTCFTVTPHDQSCCKSEHFTPDVSSFLEFFYFSPASIIYRPIIYLLFASKLTPWCLHAHADLGPAHFHRIATTFVKLWSGHSVPLNHAWIPTQTKHTLTLALIIEFQKPHFSEGLSVIGSASGVHLCYGPFFRS